MPDKKDKDSAIVGDLYISRKARRDAELAAKAEVEANARAAEDAADAADLAAYNDAHKDDGEAKRAYLAEQAYIQATDDARKANGLETSVERAARLVAEAEAQTKAVEDARAAAAKAAAKEAAKA